MRSKVLFLALLSAMVATGSFAQEHDDMYFTSKDREKMRAARETDVPAYASARKVKKGDTEADDFNPTDSYSARNVNPEYSSRSQARIAGQDDEDYYVSYYQYNSRSYNNWNNNFSSWYNSPWYRNSYWASSMYNWNRPYYGGYYDGFNSPWYDPYSSYNVWGSFSYNYGNSWNYGWGGSYSPYCSYSPYFGSNIFWNGYRYPSVVVVNDNTNAGIVYGKRPTRGTYAYDNAYGNRSRNAVSNRTESRDVNSGGRVAGNGRAQTEYYNRSWRAGTPVRTSYGTSNSSYNSRSATQYNRSGSWNSSNSSFDSRPSYTPSRSSSSFDTGGGSRSSSGSTGSGSNGRTRGRD